jgi:hypothetical protein
MGEFSEQDGTPVDVITQHHRYAGLVVNRGYRLSDILGDGNREVVEIRETRASTGGTRSADVRCRQVFLKKENILLVVPKGKYEAPIRRRNNFVGKDRYAAVIVLPGHVLSGIVHLPPRAIPSMLLDESSPLPGFIGVTNVTVHSSISDFAPPHCDVVIVRRGSIEAVQLTAQPLPKPEGTGGEGDEEPRPLRSH